VRHIDRDELDAGLLQAQQEVRITGQPIELGDDQRGPVGLAGLEGFGQRSAIAIVLAALNLDMFLD